MKMKKINLAALFLFFSLVVGVAFQNCASNDTFDTAPEGSTNSSSLLSTADSSVSFDKDEFPFAISAEKIDFAADGDLEVEIYNVTNGTNSSTDLYLCTTPPSATTDPCVESSSFVLTTQSTNPEFQYDENRMGFLFKSAYVSKNTEPGGYVFHFRRGLKSVDVRSLTVNVVSPQARCTIQVANGGTDFSPSAVGQECKNNSDPIVSASKGWYICKCR